MYTKQNNEDHFQKIKNSLLNNWYCISQIHDLKPIIKRSFRQPAQPKRDSAFEQKTRIVSSREIWGSSQNRLFSYNQKNAKQSSNGHFWKVLNVVLESFCFAQETKAVFISILYHKTSQTQDVKIQSTERSVPKIAQLKCDSAFEQKTRIVSKRETLGSSQNNFFSYNHRKSRAVLKKTILERTQRRFGKFVFSFRWNRPKIFGRFVRKSSKQLHTIQNDEDHVPKKNQKLFF